MFDLFVIFSTLFLRTERRGYGFLLSCSQNAKEAADEMNITECDPESASVTIHFFFKI